MRGGVELEALPTFWDGYAETATASAILGTVSTSFVGDWGVPGPVSNQQTARC